MNKKEKTLLISLLALCTIGPLIAMDINPINNNEIEFNYTSDFKGLDTFKKLLNKYNIAHDKNGCAVFDAQTPVKVYQAFISMHVKFIHDLLTKYTQNKIKKNYTEIVNALLDFKQVIAHLNRIPKIKMHATNTLSLLTKKAKNAVYDTHQNNMLLQYADSHFAPFKINIRQVRWQYDHSQTIPYIEQHIAIPWIYRCSYNNCKAVFNDRRNIRRHIETQHLKISLYVCSKCKKRFAYVQQLQHHKKNGCNIKTARRKRKRSEIITQEHTPHNSPLVMDTRETKHVMMLRPKRHKNHNKELNEK